MRRLVVIFLLLLAVLPLRAQSIKVTLSGTVKNGKDSKALPFVTMVLKNAADSSFVTGTITNDNGLFSIADIAPGNYVLEATSIGFQTHKQAIVISSLSAFLDLGTVAFSEDVRQLKVVTVTNQATEGPDTRMDKKTFSVTDNSSQSDGSLLQVMKNHPGITTDQDDKVLIRGNDKVVVLIDGKQTALTGFGN